MSPEQIKTLLEAAMLICFGCSWPLNLSKNIKARTAKSMSLQFIILIVTGYVCGIIAKIIGKQWDDAYKIFLFAVYIFNLIVVSANIPVYFRNKKLDKAAEENK